MNTLLSAIFKFCTTNQLFKYFRRRYSDQLLKILNKLVRTRGKIRSAISQTAFLKASVGQRTLPKFVKFRIEKSSVRQTPNMERAFMCDEIEKSKSLITFLKGKLRALWQGVRPGVGKLRPAGRMRPSRAICAAREHFLKLCHL